MASAGRPQPIFYYDLGDPLCYLAAERIMTVLPAVPEWEPVLGATVTRVGELGANAARPGEPDRDSIERLAAAQCLQPLRWPARWPPETRTAMLAATYAKRTGRGVAFSLAAFRQAFAAGRDLGAQDTLLIAGAACEMHPAALLKGLALRSTADALTQATQRAVDAGVRSLPAIEFGGRVFESDRSPEEAARSIRGAA